MDLPRTRLFVVVILAMGLSGISSGGLTLAQDDGDQGMVLEDPEGNELFEQDAGFPDCMGPEDPFCPREPGSGDDSGSGTDYPYCMKCETKCNSLGECGPGCDQVEEGETGRTSCTERYEGSRLVFCDAFNNFCERITVRG